MQQYEWSVTKLKRIKVFCILLLAISFLFCNFVQAQEIYELKQLSKSQPIIIDGYNNEPTWEESVFIKSDLPRRSSSLSRYAVFRVLADVEYLYFQAYVADSDRNTVNGIPDGIRIKMNQDGNIKEYFVAYSGDVLTETTEPYFLSAGIDNEMYYCLEIKIPFKKQWRYSGEFSLEISVIDNGRNDAGLDVSDVSQFSYLFHVDMENQMSSATTTAKTVTNAVVPTSKPSATAKITTVSEKTTKPEKTTTAKQAAMPTQGKTSVTSGAQTKYPNEVYGNNKDIWTFSDGTTALNTVADTETISDILTKQDASDSTQMKTLLRNDTEFIGQKLQTNKKETEATQAFGTIIAALLLFFGVFLLLRLKKNKNTEDKNKE